MLKLFFLIFILFKNFYSAKLRLTKKIVRVVAMEFVFFLINLSFPQTLFVIPGGFTPSLSIRPPFNPRSSNHSVSSRTHRSIISPPKNNAWLYHFDVLTLKTLAFSLVLKNATKHFISSSRVVTSAKRLYEKDRKVCTNFNEHLFAQ